MFRDFTYIDDIVNGVVNILNKIPKKNNNYNHKKPITCNSSAHFKFLILEMEKKFT